jgi:hypothetical protein
MTSTLLDDWFDYPAQHPELFESSGDWWATVTVLDPGVSDVIMQRRDVAEVLFALDGHSDGPSWIAVVRLADGRWVYMSYTVQITGDVFWEVVVAASKQRLWWWAMTDEDRERVTAVMTPEQLDEELVEIDELLESHDPAARAKGEQRMLQRHAARRGP